MDNIEHDSRRDEDADAFTEKIVWGSMLFSILIYAGIGYFLVEIQGMDPGNTDIVGMLAGILGVLSVGQIGITVFLKKSVMDEGSDFSMKIMIWAILEAIGVYGLVVVILGGTFMHGVSFFAVSALVLALNGPSTF